MEDRDYMQRAFSLAKKGLGYVSPNPMVGAVLVKGNRIIGEGLHERFGQNHAEVNAIKNSVEDPQGATLYCTLEPCCHKDKKTPPCTDLIIKSRISKVVVSNLDPNPKVSGVGIEKLCQHGIEVQHGILQEKGERFNETFFHYIVNRTPFVHIKMAQTLDGKLCTNNGHSKWITGKKARKKAHILRKEYDAVLIGRETLNNDDPALTCRLEEADFEQQPLRLVVGNPELMDQDSRLFNDKYKEKTIIVSTLKKEDMSIKVKKLLEGRDVIFMKKQSGEQFWRTLWQCLGERNVASVLVEGGPTLINSLLHSGQWKKLSSFISPQVLGNGFPFYSSSVEKIEGSIFLKWATMAKYGTDFCLVGYKE